MLKRKSNTLRFSKRVRPLNARCRKPSVSHYQVLSNVLFPSPAPVSSLLHFHMHTIAKCGHFVHVMSILTATCLNVFGVATNCHPQDNDLHKMQISSIAKSGLALPHLLRSLRMLLSPRSSTAQSPLDLRRTHAPSSRRGRSPREGGGPEGKRQDARYR